MVPGAACEAKKVKRYKISKDGLYAGYCGGIPIPRCQYWYSIVVSQKYQTNTDIIHAQLELCVRGERKISFPRTRTQDYIVIVKHDILQDPH